MSVSIDRLSIRGVITVPSFDLEFIEVEQDDDDEFEVSNDFELEDPELHAEALSWISIHAQKVG